MFVAAIEKKTFGKATAPRLSQRLKGATDEF